jgi:hypothetical protein
VSDYARSQRRYSSVPFGFHLLYTQTEKRFFSVQTVRLGGASWGSSVRRDCASPSRIGFAPEISLRGAGMADRTILARLEAVQGTLAAESAKLVAAMRWVVETWNRTPEPGVRKQLEDELSELQATRVATEQRRRHALKRIDELRWDLLQERMWMEESFEERYSEQPIRYVHDGSCVLDRDFGRRPVNEPLAFGLHEANLLWQPTAASHSFGRPHLLQAEMDMDGDCVHTVLVVQHPAHLRTERAHYLQHELPHQQTVFAARPYFQAEPADSSSHGIRSTASIRSSSRALGIRRRRQLWAWTAAASSSRVRTSKRSSLRSLRRTRQLRTVSDLGSSRRVTRNYASNRQGSGSRRW